MSKKYIPRTKEEKMQYAKRFSKGERESYRKGVRQGFLQGIHKLKKSLPKDAKKRHYTKEQFDSLFDDITKIEI